MIDDGRRKITVYRGQRITAAGKPSFYYLRRRRNVIEVVDGCREIVMDDCGLAMFFGNRSMDILGVEHGYVMEFLSWIGINTVEDCDRVESVYNFYNYLPGIKGSISAVPSSDEIGNQVLTLSTMGVWISMRYRGVSCPEIIGTWSDTIHGDITHLAQKFTPELVGHMARILINRDALEETYGR